MSRRILMFESLLIVAALVAAILAYPHLPPANRDALGHADAG